MNKTKWLRSLKPGDKVRCFKRTGKGGRGEVMTIDAIGSDGVMESGIAVLLEEYPDMLDSFWIEELREAEES